MNSQEKTLCSKLIQNHALTKEEYVTLLAGHEKKELRDELAKEAIKLRRKYYGNKVFTRGLIEFTNYCKNNCYYCGIQGSNRQVHRYRLSKEDILSCCANGYELGFRTFVLQGGEDPYYTDERLEDVIRTIKERYPSCAITLSVGERSYESYKRLKIAGADRYLLRHETASKELYRRLHPQSMQLANRLECLTWLKDLGYQVGAGFMVGAPSQTLEDLALDLEFLKEFAPEMIGIGPFIPHHDTIYAQEEPGSMTLTLLLLSILRILLPDVLLPATTALGTLEPMGREKGILAGANVVMPNLSPVKNRKDYELYDNKICTSDEAAHCVGCMGRRVASVGYELVEERGDHVSRRMQAQEIRQEKGDSL